MLKHNITDIYFYSKVSKKDNLSVASQQSRDLILVTNSPSAEKPLSLSIDVDFIVFNVS